MTWEDICERGNEVKLNLPLSRQLAQQYATLDRQCYRNCYRVFHAEPLVAGGYYVEGFGVQIGAVMHHAWLEVDSEIIDVTPTWYDSKIPTVYVPIRGFSRKSVPEAYLFPIIRLTTDEAKETHLRALHVAYEAIKLEYAKSRGDRDHE